MNSVYIPKIQPIDTSEFLKNNFEPLFQTEILRIDIVQHKDKPHNFAFIHFKSPLPKEISDKIDQDLFTFKDNYSKSKFMYLFKRNNAPIPSYPEINNSQICENFKIQGELIVKLTSTIEALTSRLEVLESIAQSSKIDNALPFYGDISFIDNDDDSIITQK